MRTLSETKDRFKRGEIDKASFIAEMYNMHHSKLFDYCQGIRNTQIGGIELTESDLIFTTKGDGIRLKCPQYDHRVAPIEILNFGDYEKENFDIFTKFFQQDYVLFDIGANIGWYSLKIASLFQKTKIFAFEPIPRTFECLNENIKLNNFQNIKTFNHGFYDSEKEVTFHYYPEGSGNSSIKKLSQKNDQEEIISKVLRLDSFVELNQIRVDIIKCDVEGAELFVFKGGLITIKKYLPVIFTEMLRKWSNEFGYHPNDIISLLGQFGYKCYYQNGRLLKEIDVIDDHTESTNFFFLNTEKHLPLYSNLII